MTDSDNRFDWHSDVLAVKFYGCRLNLKVIVVREVFGFRVWNCRPIAKIGEPRKHP